MTDEVHVFAFACGARVLIREINAHGREAPEWIKPELPQAIERDRRDTNLSRHPTDTGRWPSGFT